MKEPRLSGRARADLHEIWLYIASDTPEAADRFIQRLLATCRKLASSPSIGRAREELARGIRSFPVGSHVIFYRVSKSGIEVVRVLSGYRDIEALFGL